MKKRVIGSILLIAAACGCASRSSSQKPLTATPQEMHNASMQRFGQAPTGGTLEQVPVKTLLASIDSYNGKLLKISGTVSQVCPKRGCWLTLGDDQAQPLFVKFTCPIDGRLIPLEAVGKPAVVEGTVTVVSMSEEEARHYQEDAGASPEEVARIVGPQKRITVASPAASIAALP